MKKNNNKKNKQTKQNKLSDEFHSKPNDIVRENVQ